MRRGSVVFLVAFPTLWNPLGKVSEEPNSLAIQISDKGTSLFSSIPLAHRVLSVNYVLQMPIAGR